MPQYNNIESKLEALAVAWIIQRQQQGYIGAASVFTGLSTDQVVMPKIHAYAHSAQEIVHASGNFRVRLEIAVESVALVDPVAPTIATVRVELDPAVLGYQYPGFPIGAVLPLGYHHIIPPCRDALTDQDVPLIENYHFTLQAEAGTITVLAGGSDIGPDGPLTQSSWGFTIDYRPSAHVFADHSQLVSEVRDSFLYDSILSNTLGLGSLTPSYAADIEITVIDITNPECNEDIDHAAIFRSVLRLDVIAANARI